MIVQVHTYWPKDSSPISSQCITYLTGSCIFQINHLVVGTLRESAEVSRTATLVTTNITQIHCIE